MIHKTIKQKFEVNFEYNIYFSEDIFNINNKLLFQILTKENKNKNKIIIFIDKNLLKFHKNLKNKIIDYFYKFRLNIELVCHPIIMPGSEQLKNRFLFLKKFYNFIEYYKICRQSYILSIGGGTLQDFIGYLAATAHRGVKLIRIPTTVLSQDDSGVGVKNSINYKNKKNFIGTFAPPYAVINDHFFLTSLDYKNFIAGFSEAIKVALINDTNLFSFIEENYLKINDRQSCVINNIIFDSANLHAIHISKNGDPFETLSSRPLDFGHWSAHKLESLSKYKISHGEAVAVGILIDVTYSYFIGLLKRHVWKRILKLFINLKFKIYFKELSLKNKNEFLIFKGLEEFREHLGGKLTITLIKDIGYKIDINHINLSYYKKIFIFLYKLNNKLKKQC